MLPFPGVPETAIVTGRVDGGGVHEAGSGRDIESRSSNHWQPNLKEAAVCSVILHGSARERLSVARSRILAPEHISSPRSLLSITRSRYICATSRRTRMDQTRLEWRGVFWPTSNPLFHGSRRVAFAIEGTSMAGPPPARPPRRSMARILVTDTCAPQTNCEFVRLLLAQSRRPSTNGLNSRNGRC